MHGKTAPSWRRRPRAADREGDTEAGRDGGKIRIVHLSYINILQSKPFIGIVVVI